MGHMTKLKLRWLGNVEILFDNNCLGLHPTDLETHSITFVCGQDPAYLPKLVMIGIKFTLVR